MNSLQKNKTLNSLKKVSQELSLHTPFRNIIKEYNFLGNSVFKWPALKIGNLKARLPIIQGGMGVGISLSGLASAVANAGGIGVIAANGIGMLEKDYFKNGSAAGLRAFRSEIRKARQKTDGIIAVNIMVAVNDFHELLDTAIEEKVDLVIMGAGLPIKNIPVKKMRANGVKAAPIVSSARAAEMIFRMWTKIYNDCPDAVIFEGPKAGGHLGFAAEQIEDPAYQLEAIVPQIVSAIKPFEAEKGQKIPVIAGGGVYSGEDIHSVLSLGAAGVQMGTRFVATEECDASEEFKKAYITCEKEDIGLIKSPVGMPGRAIRNQFIKDSEQGKRPGFRCAWQCLASCKAEAAQYCISIALNNARRGKMKHGFVFAGTNAYRIKEIVSVNSLVSELASAYKQKSKAHMESKLEIFVAKIQDMLDQYNLLDHKKRELGSAYQSALAAKVKNIQDNGLSIMRKQYENTLNRFRVLQFDISEELASFLGLLNS